MITLTDSIYGTHEVSGVLEALLGNSQVKRLAGIHHSGAIFLVNPLIAHHRLEHSIGVMLLIKLLNGSELEQVAGLLHDVSHTVFSHVGDYIFNNTQEDHHELIFEHTLRSGEIPFVLEKYGYSVEQLLAGPFDILEQPLPGLCADRLDYTLRDAIHARLISKQKACSFLENVVLQNGVIMIKDHIQADWLNNLYKRLNEEVYNEPLYVYANQQMAVLIQELIANEILKEDDLLKDDTYMLNKISSTARGYEALRDIKTRKGYAAFIHNGASIKIKRRHLEAPVLS